MKALPRLPAVETSDVRPSLLALGAGLLLTIMILCVAAAVAIVSWDRGEEIAPSASLDRQNLRQGVRLEIDPHAAGVKLENAAKERVKTLGWSDRQHKLAHVPIERAMDMLAAHGWPDGDER